MITVVRPAPAPRFNVLRTIAVYKLVKVLLLLALAYGEVRLSDASLAAKLVNWASARPLGLEHDVETRFLEWLSSLSESSLHSLPVVTWAQAAAIVNDGVRLWVSKLMVRRLSLIIN